MPCTTLLAGKNATYDGSTLMARNEDSGEGHFTSKKFIVVNPSEQPRHYKSVISGVEIELPEDPLRYTAMPNALPDEGIWGEAGINACNVAMSETETLTSNPRVLGADPLVKEGIGEEDMLTIVLPYIRSAREGVLRLGELIERYGTYEMNGIGFQDLEEIWWFESVGGHHWLAKRVPDDAYVVMPNQQGIDFFDFADAYGEGRDHLCAADLADFIRDNHLDVHMNVRIGSNHGAASLKDPEVTDASDLHTCTRFDVRGSLGSRSDSDHVYNTPRAWFMLRYLNPHTYRWEGEAADYTPESDDLPWSLVPERRLTIEDFKYVLSSHYQGTDYDPYGREGMPDKRGKYRAIGINRNNFLSVTQLRPYVPKEIAGIQWIAEGSNAFNTMVPFYTNITRTPEYLANTTKTVSTENFYWANRLIGALADAHFGACIAHVERYQLKTMSQGYQFLGQGDREYLERFSGDAGADASGVMCNDVESACIYPLPGEDSRVCQLLEEWNQKIAEMVREATDDLLDKVLFTASCAMKNGFSRDDK